MGDDLKVPLTVTQAPKQWESIKPQKKKSVQSQKQYLGFRKITSSPNENETINKSAKSVAKIGSNRSELKTKKKTMSKVTEGSSDTSKKVTKNARKTFTSTVSSTPQASEEKKVQKKAPQYLVNLAVAMTKKESAFNTSYQDDTPKIIAKRIKDRDDTLIGIMDKLGDKEKQADLIKQVLKSEISENPAVNQQVLMSGNGVGSKLLDTYLERHYPREKSSWDEIRTSMYESAKNELETNKLGSK